MLWLARAEAEGLSVLELKEAIRVASAKPVAPYTSGAAVADVIAFVEKRMGMLGTNENSTFFLCELIQTLETKLNALDGVVRTTGAVEEQNEFDTCGARQSNV